MTRAVDARPSATASGVVAGAVVLLADAREQEDLVVHREPEEDGEHHHRDEGRDGPGLLDAEDAVPPSPLEHGDDHAVRGADRQQVHDHGLQRDEQAAEHGHQQQEAEHEHRADEDRQARRQSFRHVDARRGEAAHVHLHVGTAQRRGDDVVAQGGDEVGGGDRLRRARRDHADDRGVARRADGRSDDRGDVGRLLQLRRPSSSRARRCRRPSGTRPRAPAGR